MQQSRERQDYLEKKILRLIESIEGHFDYIAEMLSKKKVQIIQYYDGEFQKYLEDHRNYDREIEIQAEWIRSYRNAGSGAKLVTVEQIEEVGCRVKEMMEEDYRVEKRITKVLMGKERVKIEKLWNEENLEKVLFEIENIAFKIDGGKGDRKKKRVITEHVMELGATINGMKSSNNSRFPSGRKQVTPST